MLGFLHSWDFGGPLENPEQRRRFILRAAACGLRWSIRQPRMRRRTPLSSLRVHQARRRNSRLGFIYLRWERWSLQIQHFQGYRASQVWELQYHCRERRRTCRSIVQYWAGLHCLPGDCWVQWLQVRSISTSRGSLRNRPRRCQPRCCRHRVRILKWSSFLECQELMGIILGCQRVLQDPEREEYMRHCPVQLLPSGRTTSWSSHPQMIARIDITK